MRSVARHHVSWLDVIETTGPFITLPVAKEAFAHGLEATRKELVAELRRRVDELHGDPSTRLRIIRFVLSELLEHEPVLRDGPAVPMTLTYTAPEHGVTVRPDFVVVEPTDEPPRARLLTCVWPAGTNLLERVAGERWTASPADRMSLLLRATGVKLGLVTDGLRWTLVSAAAGSATGTASWDADIWLEERSTLDAFTNLLGRHRFFGVAHPDQIEALLERSAEAQEEVTNQLGLQVRNAVALLVDAFGRLDRESGGTLLRGTASEEVYAAAVAVMMRLVFLLYAEERHLFPIDDLLYQSAYAASTLRADLERRAQTEGEGPLDLRFEAWSRLLATFRVIHDGVQHEDLSQLAYGGSLFDPDRYPFLEGRRPGESAVVARPIKVSDLTVKYILDALQILTFNVQGVREARKLSFRSLDVEQIGHVYEGLLDHGVVRVDSVHLGLGGKLEPEIALTDLEEAAQAGADPLAKWVCEVTGMTDKQVAKALAAEPPSIMLQRLRGACEGDDVLVARVRSFLGLVRSDPRGVPTVYLPGCFYVTKSRERRSAGAYYTPRLLAEEMVQHALEPLVYSPGPQDTDDRSQWRLKSVEEMLRLKICDFTMGSAAFLVAASRYLADRLIEASGDGTAPDEEVPEEVLAGWRRRVVEHCLYGVDRDPMAVEMAKLSLWLVTLSKDRPFTFLDGQLASGDALLGITSLDQVSHFHLAPEAGRQLHSETLFGDHLASLRDDVSVASALRDELANIEVRTVRDADEKARLQSEYGVRVERVRIVADLLIGASLSSARRGGDGLDSRLRGISQDVDRALTETDGDMRRFMLEDLAATAKSWLDEGRPDDAPARRPLHWPLTFPEVFTSGNRFDAIIGNPPFSGGQHLTGRLGLDYREYLVRQIGESRRGSADLVAYMFLRAAQLADGIALLATNTIAQGDTREVGLDALLTHKWVITRAVKSRKWPGDANLEISQVWLRCNWQGARELIPSTASGAAQVQRVVEINSSLAALGHLGGGPKRLTSNARLSFIGSYVLGMGFVLDPEEAEALIALDQRNREVLQPYLNGEDLNSRPDCSASRWVINFFDWPEERARTYHDCWDIVERLVRPERQRLRPDGTYAVRTPRRQRYWAFAERQAALYEAIAPLDRVLVIARVSSVVQPVMVPTGQVLSDALTVFAFDDFAHLALLCSSFHTWWAQSRASTLRNDVRYTPSDCFETFAMATLDEPADEAGRNLHETRHAFMFDHQLGLTKTYNLVHDPDVRDCNIEAVREAHIAVDEAILHCYGWDDLALDHGFHDTPLGRRFAVSPAARAEFLHRLLVLNHERAAAEAASQATTPARKRAAKGHRPAAAEMIPLLEVTP
jgi:hypothetical protein